MPWHASSCSSARGPAVRRRARGRVDVAQRRCPGHVRSPSGPATACTSCPGWTPSASWVRRRLPGGGSRQHCGTKPRTTAVGERPAEPRETPARPGGHCPARPSGTSISPVGPLRDVRPRLRGFSLLRRTAEVALRLMPCSTSVSLRLRSGSRRRGTEKASPPPPPPSSPYASRQSPFALRRAAVSLARRRCAAADRRMRGHYAHVLLSSQPL